MQNYQFYSTVNTKIFMLHQHSCFLRSKKLAGICQHAKIKLIHCLLLPKFAVLESYNPYDNYVKLVALHEQLHMRKYAHLQNYAFVTFIDCKN